MIIRSEQKLVYTMVPASMVSTILVQLRADGFKIAVCRPTQERLLDPLFFIVGEKESETARHD